jgi:hypothetical protein
MKYVQIGILACLMVIAGLLFGIYSGQQSPRVEPAASEPVPEPIAEPVSLAEADAPAAAVQEPALDRPSVPDEAKPSPLPSKQAERRSQAALKRNPASPDPPAQSPEAVIPEAMPDSPEAVPESNEEFAQAEELDMPPPVTEPVIPNLPPLVGMPEPAPLPEPQLVTVPEGTEIVVRMVNTLSTNRNLPGDTFEATLEQPLAVSGWLVAPKGSRVEGRVLESKKAGRVKGVAELSFNLVSLTTAEGKTVDIATAALGQAGEKSRGEDMKRIGWGAGIGAIIGAIAGGGKGAAIGAGTGAGAGAGTVLVTRGETVVVPTETRVTFRLLEPLEVTSTKPLSL